MIGIGVADDKLTGDLDFTPIIPSPASSPSPANPGLTKQDPACTHHTFDPAYCVGTEQERYMK